MFEDGLVKLGDADMCPDGATWIGKADVQVFMSGDLLWVHTALGKEGYQSWWCPYCNRFKTDWQEQGHEGGDAWTIEKLTEQARKIVAGEVNVKRPSEVMGVKEAPIFDAIEVDHYVIPVLHLTIGLVNDVLDHLVQECQAAAEKFSDEYYKLEEEMVRVTQDLMEAVVTLATFMEEHKENIKNCRRMLRMRNRLTAEEVAQFERELAQFEDEKKPLQDSMDTLKGRKEAISNGFKEEIKKSDNSKEFGQPVRAYIDNVLRDHGIDRAVQHGGKLEGNQCRKLLKESKEILEEIKQHILSRPQECRIAGTDEEVDEVFKWHHLLCLALDGLFSGLRTIRYKINNETITMTENFRDRVLAIARYLGKFLFPNHSRTTFCSSIHSLTFLPLFFLRLQYNTQVACD
jgi:hypothetical protein